MRYAQVLRSLLLAITTLLIGNSVARAVVVTCNGGAHEAVFVVTQNAPTSTTSAVFVPIADAQISAGASGFPGDLDTYIVTFSGESDSSAGAWEIEAEVSINGGAFVNINPTGPNTFQFGKQTNSPSMTWCTRVQATASAVFRMQWRHINGGTANLDDYTMTVRRFN